MALALSPSMLLALRAVRDGGNLSRAEHFWLLDGEYITVDNKLTLSGHNELNNDDNRNEDKPK